MTNNNNLINETNNNNHPIDENSLLCGLTKEELAEGAADYFRHNPPDNELAALTVLEEFFKHKPTHDEMAAMNESFTISKIGDFINPIFIITSLGFAIWLIVLTFQLRGIFLGIMSCIVLPIFIGLLQRIGWALVVMVLASYLCFTDHVCGIWLPMTSYILGAISFILALRLLRNKSIIEKVLARDPE